MTQTKILLDTDIGTDIDDAVCLAYLLANPRCDLLGITTLTGEPERRAAMASAMCRVAGRRVPIHSGTPLPMEIAQRQKEAAQAVALSRWPHDADFPPATAVEFLRRTIRENPGEVVLLTIGPMTNIALLFALDPAIPAMLKGVVSMCGKFADLIPNLEPLEWNAMLDPTATAMVYDRVMPFHRSIGVDITRQVTMPKEEVRQRFQAPLLRPVLDFAEVWFGHADTIVFHDPLAAAVIWDEHICRFERGVVTVDKAGEQAGATRWRAEAAGRHEVAVAVDRERFIGHYFSMFPA
jgi:purine nucleosidase